jgi:uncharacterized protein with PIN domain
MSSDKDKLGEKLHEKERAEEDRYFQEHERELVEKLRKKQSAQGHETHGLCPRCGERLASVKEHGVTVEECPAGHGLWVDRGEIETIAQRERDSWLGRFFYRPRR